MADTVVKDFSVTVKMRNNQMVERREILGLSAPEVAKQIGISYGIYLGYENMNAKPFHAKTEELKTSAKKIADFFGVLWEDLWPDTVLAIKKSKVIRKIGSEEMRLMTGSYTVRTALPPSEILEGRELSERVDAVLETLNPKEREVIVQTFGLDGGDPMTFDEVGESLLRGRDCDEGYGEGTYGYGVTKSRVRQIRVKALRKLRSSDRNMYLKDFVQ